MSVVRLFLYLSLSLVQDIDFRYAGVFPVV